MGLFGSARREFIARPDAAKEQIVYKWPDENIRRYTRLTVEADEAAVFFRSGQVAGVIAPGTAVLDSSEIPFLGNLVDAVTGGDLFKTELYFVSTREVTGQKFGGAVDDLLDPDTQLAVGLRAYGECSLQVADPAALIVRMLGTGSHFDDEVISQWAAEQLMKAFRTVVTARITAGAWPVLGLAAHSTEIEQEVLAAVQPLLAEYGLAIPRLGNFTVSLKPEDEANLKRLKTQVQYTKMAGSLQQAAAAEALAGIGEGAAKGGPADSAAMMGVGLTFGRALTGDSPGQEPAPAGAAPAPAAAYCPHCGRPVREGDVFCSGCGTKLV